MLHCLENRRVLNLCGDQVPAAAAVGMGTAPDGKIIRFRPS